MNRGDPEPRQSFPVLWRAIAAVPLETVAWIKLSSTIHQLALDDLGKAAGERDGRNERVCLGKRHESGVEPRACIFEPVDDVKTTTTRINGAHSCC